MYLCFGYKLPWLVHVLCLGLGYMEAVNSFMTKCFVYVIHCRYGLDVDSAGKKSLLSKNVHVDQFTQNICQDPLANAIKQEKVSHVTDMKIEIWSTKTN